MDTTNIISIISTVGFPIAMCGAMGYYVKYISDKNREQIKDINERHDEELKDTLTAINNNTLAIQSLCSALEKRGLDV